MTGGKIIRRKAGQAIEFRKDMFSGSGEVTVKHYFKKDEINAPCRYCAQLVLAPGSRIGLHGHNDEDEIIIIHEGRALVNDNGREAELEAGDSMITRDGSMHSIKNISTSDLVITSIIIQYKHQLEVVI
ncbi:MAG: cupin domain-containing protein [Elusimicrobiota bacterium]